MSTPILIPSYQKLNISEPVSCQTFSKCHSSHDNNIKSHSYPPSRYKLNFRRTCFNSSNKDYRNFRINKKIRKCAYILGIISQDYFREFGGLPLEEDCNIFVAKRVYKGDANNETCAVIGINKHYVRYLFDDNSILYQILKSSKLLKDIYGIESLRAYRLEPLKQLIKFLFFVSENDLIIFNIEPKGLNEKARIYPTANVCIPGGGMENEDSNCYEMCGRREFQEETKIVIPKIIKYIIQQKFILSDRHAVYFMIKMFKTKEKIIDSEEKTIDKI